MLPIRFLLTQLFSLAFLSIISGWVGVFKVIAQIICFVQKGDYVRLGSSYGVPAKV